MPGIGTWKSTSLPCNVGIQEHNVTLERCREATDARPRQDDEIISNGAGSRVDIVESEESLPRRDRLCRQTSAMMIIVVAVAGECHPRLQDRKSSVEGK